MFYILSPGKTSKPAKKNAMSGCYDDRHCAVKELLELRNYLAQGMKKRGFRNG
jgi:hypothetical protein